MKKKKKFNKMLADASIVPATVALSSPHQNPKKILFKNKNETQKKKKKNQQHKMGCTHDFIRLSF